LKKIPYSRQCLDAADIRAVVRVLKSPFLTQGPEIEKFEKEFAHFCGAKYAVACSSATAGLHLSAMVLGMGPGDLWWTSPNTFCATADAAVRCGAGVDFIDIEWGTYNMNLNLLEDRLKQAARKNRLPKAVAPVHFAGNPVDMEFLNRLRRRYGFKVVEDAAHATGARFRGEKVGSCKWSDLCVFSFHAVKIITTGEGGMVTTNSENLYERLRLLRSHGISREAKYRSSRQKYPWYYEKLAVGNHYRMTDMQAALGRSQLSKIGKLNAKRKKLAALYDRCLPGWLILPEVTPGADSSWHLYVTLTPPAYRSRDLLLETMGENDIQGAVHYPPVPALSFYRKKFPSGEFRKKCPKSMDYFQRAVSIPLFPQMSEYQVRRVAGVMEGRL